MDTKKFTLTIDKTLLPSIDVTSGEFKINFHVPTLEGNAVFFTNQEFAQQCLEAGIGERAFDKIYDKAANMIIDSLNQKIIMRILKKGLKAAE